MVSVNASKPICALLATKSKLASLFLALAIVLGTQKVQIKHLIMIKKPNGLITTIGKVRQQQKILLGSKLTSAKLKRLVDLLSPVLMMHQSVILKTLVY